MNEINVEEMKKELTDKLIESGVAEDCAREAASREIDSMGVVKTSTGQCPLGYFSAMACTLCSFGHMTECHWPVCCEEAQCSHYQAELIDAGEYAGFFEE